MARFHTLLNDNPDRPMKQFIHVPTHLKTNRIMPGHGRTARGTGAPIPGVDRTERRARRAGWTDAQAKRRRQYGLGGSIGLIGAMLALVLTIFAALGPNTNVLDRPANPPTIELVTTQPADTPTDTPTDAVRLG